MVLKPSAVYSYSDVKQIGKARLVETAFLLRPYLIDNLFLIRVKLEKQHLNHTTPPQQLHRRDRSLRIMTPTRCPTPSIIILARSRSRGRFHATPTREQDGPARSSVKYSEKTS